MVGLNNATRTYRNNDLRTVLEAAATFLATSRTIIDQNSKRDIYSGLFERFEGITSSWGNPFLVFTIRDLVSAKSSGLPACEYAVGMPSSLRTTTIEDFSRKGERARVERTLTFNNAHVVAFTPKGLAPEEPQPQGFLEKIKHFWEHTLEPYATLERAVKAARYSGLAAPSYFHIGPYAATAIPGSDVFAISLPKKDDLGTLVGALEKAVGRG